jgi:hypothetical protein
MDRAQQALRFGNRLGAREAVISQRARGLPLFSPQAPYRLDDCLWLAELDHVPAFLGDDMGRSRG